MYWTDLCPPQGPGLGSSALPAPAAVPLERRRRHYGALPLGDDPLGCDDIGRLDAGADLCDFVRNHCASESLVDWPRLYYCHVAAAGPLPTGLLLAGCAALLALLFCVIARAADDFFSCILSQISQDLGLPPRLGGVTLLALGNGAPDLSASIAAVKTGEVWCGSSLPTATLQPVDRRGRYPGRNGRGRQWSLLDCSSFCTHSPPFPARRRRRARQATTSWRWGR